MSNNIDRPCCSIIIPAVNQSSIFNLVVLSFYFMVVPFDLESEKNDLGQQ